MQTLKTEAAVLDFLSAVDTDTIYIRFSNGIDEDEGREFSRNWNTHSPEAGVSVAAIPAIDFSDPFTSGMELFDFVTEVAKLAFTTRAAYFCTGEFVGMCSDGYHLLANVEPVAEISWNVLRSWGLGIDNPAYDGMVEV